MFSQLQTSKREGIRGDEMINLLLFHLSMLFWLFFRQTNKLGVYTPIGMFIVRVIPEVWPSG